MANRIKIKKGLQIPLLGEPEEVLRGSVKSEFVKICPGDYTGIIPKLSVKVDDRVKAGSPLFYAKDHPEVLFASPVSGVVTEIERGAKRRILNIVVKADSEIEYVDNGAKDVNSLSAEEVKICLQEKFAEVLATKNKGQIMKAVMGELKGKADGKVINQVVGELCK